MSHRTIHAQDIETLKRRITERNPEKGLMYSLAIDELSKRKDELLDVLWSKAKIESAFSRPGQYKITLPNGLGAMDFCIVKDVLIIQNLYVGQIGNKPSVLRHFGIGKLLVNKVKDFAVKNGLKRIMLNSTEDAQGFYEKLGFEKYPLGKGVRPYILRI